MYKPIGLYSRRKGGLLTEGFLHLPLRELIFGGTLFRILMDATAEASEARQNGVNIVQLVKKV